MKVMDKSVLRPVTHRSASRLSLLTFVAFVLSSLALLWSTYLEIFLIWINSGTYAHGIVVLPVSAYLIWRKRGELIGLHLQPAPVVLVAIALLMAVVLVARIGGVQVIEHAAAVALLPAGVACFLGTALTRRIAFPLAYLAFAVPAGDALVPVLQDFTAEFATRALRMTGVAVLLEGRFIYIPNGTFEVAKACSGVRYLIATLAIGTLYAYLTYESTLYRAIFFGVSVVIPVFANAVRAYGIIMLAYLTDNQIAVGVDHIIYGWLFFGVVIFVLFLIGGWLRKKEWREPRTTAQDDAERQSPREQWSELKSVSTLLAAVGLLATVAYHDLMSMRESGSSSAYAPSLPAGTSGWYGPNPSITRWAVDYRGADDVQVGSYDDGGRQVELRRVIYLSTSRDGELISSENAIYDQKLWLRVAEKYRRVAVKDADLTINELVLKGRDKELVVWSWFSFGKHQEARPAVFKWHETVARLRGRNNVAAAIHVAAPFRFDPEEARAVLQDYLDAMYGDLIDVEQDQ